MKERLLPGAMSSVLSIWEEPVVVEVVRPVVLRKMPLVAVVSTRVTNSESPLVVFFTTTVMLSTDAVLFASGSVMVA